MNGKNSPSIQLWGCEQLLVMHVHPVVAVCNESGRKIAKGINKMKLMTSFNDIILKWIFIV